MLLLIDANSLIHRCYHALPPLTNKKGEPTGALYGVAGIVLKIIQQTKPAHCAALFDRPEPTFRKEKFADYKIHRPKADDELIAQIIKAHDLFDAFSIPWIEKAGYEADDLIGALAKKFSEQEPVRILTGDLDSLQLVHDDAVDPVRSRPAAGMATTAEGRSASNGVEVETFKKGVSETLLYNEARVHERYGLRPDQLIDYKALVGDTSDNIPGVAGVGPKTAATILQKYGTLDDFLSKGRGEKAYEKISSHKDIAFLSRELATIDQNVPVDIKLSDLVCSFSPKKALAFFEEQNFTSLIKRLEGSHAVIATPMENRGKQSHDSELNPEEKIMLQLLEMDPNKRMPQSQIEKELKKRGLWDIWQNIERPLIPVLEDMQKAGIRVDKARLKKTETKLIKEIETKEQKLKKSISDINFNSPKQVLEALNSKFSLKLKSTSADALAKINDPPKALEDLLAYRELFKLRTTYLHPLQDLVQKDGRIHPTFLQIGAATGRIACTNPNLQNIPQESKWSGEIRGAFVAAKGHSLLSCDYSQIELRVLAHLTQDQQMMDAFVEGKDIHTRTAAFVFGVPDEKVDKSMRRMAKTLNFGMVYGMGYRAFAQSAGIPGDEAKKFMQKYFEEFATIKKWQEKILTGARKKGYVQNESGRIRHLPGLYASNQFMASEAQRAAINMPTQGLAADILKLAMVKVHTKARMILTIHDELIFEIPDAMLKNGDKSDIVQDIKKTMESAYKLSVPLAVSASIGKTWKEL